MSTCIMGRHPGIVGLLTYFNITGTSSGHVAHCSNFSGIIQLQHLYVHQFMMYDNTWMLSGNVFTSLAASIHGSGQLFALTTSE